MFDRVSQPRMSDHGFLEPQHLGARGSKWRSHAGAHAAGAPLCGMLISAI
jgi:hypothetical protein